MGELYMSESLVDWERCLRADRFFAEFGQYDAQPLSSWFFHYCLTLLLRGR